MPLPEDNAATAAADEAAAATANATQGPTLGQMANADAPAAPAAPKSAHDTMKDKVRAALAAQPFRGNAVTKADLLAVVDVLIDG